MTSPTREEIIEACRHLAQEDRFDAVFALFQPLAEENRKLRETLQLIAGQTPRNHNSKADPDREHYLRSVLISLAKTALQPQDQGGAS